MAIYLGGNKLQLNLGGTSIREAYLGGVKVLGEVPLPALAANSFRVQFDDSSYDPTVGVWGGNTILTLGWTAVRRRSGIWDLTAPSGSSLRNGFVPFSTNGDNPTSSPWRVLQVNANSSWNDFLSLFNGQPTLEEVPVWNIPVGSDVTYMFVGTSALENGVAWAKKVATTLQVYTTNNTFGNTKYASSIPTDFGGTKDRTVTVNPGWVTVTSSSPYSYTVSVAPGDVLTCRARNYGLIRNTRCQASWVSGSFVNRNGLPNAYVTERNTRSDPNTTFRWGYADGSRRSVKVDGTTTNTNTNTSLYSRVAVYLESFNFL